MKRIVIIGGGIAGISAAEAARSVSDDEVVILSAERGLPYSRPMLTKTPLKRFDTASWTIHDEDWFKRSGIRYMSGETVSSADAAAHTVTAGGRKYEYDKLIIATGAGNFIPPIPGIEKKNVYTIREASDIYAVKSECVPHAEAVIIGGGVIGVEVALELIRYGVKPTILEALPYLMTKQIDEEISDGMVKRMAPKVEIVTNAKITRISGGARGSSVDLDDGRTFPCDFVIAATGFRARTSIGEAVGAKLGRSIMIDDHARTSVGDVFAAGDCAEYGGVNHVLWSQGIIQGKTAGLNAAGCPARFDKIDSTLVINSPLMCLCAIGDMGKTEGAAYDIRYIETRGENESFFVNRRHGEAFEKQYWLNEKLVGSAILGNLSARQSRRDEIMGEADVIYE